MAIVYTCCLLILMHCTVKSSVPDDTQHYSSSLIGDSKIMMMDKPEVGAIQPAILRPGQLVKVNLKREVYLPFYGNLESWMQISPETQPDTQGWVHASFVYGSPIGGYDVSTDQRSISGYSIRFIRSGCRLPGFTSCAEIEMANYPYAECLQNDRYTLFIFRPNKAIGIRPTQQEYDDCSIKKELWVLAAPGNIVELKSESLIMMFEGQTEEYKINLN